MTRQSLRGLAALGILAVLLGGVPVMLLAWGADPLQLLPEQWPRIDDISRWPEQGWAALRWAWLDGSLPAHLLVAVAWSSWLTLAAMILAETSRQLRDHASRIPGRRWIAGLVAAAILVCTTTTAASALPASQVVATAPHRPQAEHTGRTWVDPLVRPECPRIVVLDGDTVWGLAAYHLGDGRRYHEIEDLNADRIPHAAELYPQDLLLLPADARVPAKPRQDTGSVRVESGDSLASIAARELGDPGAWRVLFDLNQGRTQPDGRALRDPNFLRPGWRLALPSVAPQPAPPNPASPSQPSVSPPVAPLPVPKSGDAFELPTGAYVGLGLAALITAATVTVRLRRRRAYRPGRQHRDDSTTTPVVRALRIIHDTSVDHSPSEGVLPTELRDRAQATADAVLPADGTAVVGVRDGHAVAVDLARRHGLGLTGPGAHAAARALLIAILASATPGTVVVMPVSNAHALFGALPDSVPACLRIVDDLACALDICDTEYRSARRVVLVTTPHADDRRLRATLGPRIARVLLGDWPPGGTAHVRVDGTVTHTATGAADLDGTRLFNLPAANAADLLALLYDAQPQPPHADEDSLGEGYEFAAEPGDGRSPVVPAEPGATAAASVERPALRLIVLGRPRLLHRAANSADVIDVFAPRQREILLCLALHPDGIRRATLTAMLWPDASGERPYNSFRATLSQLRRALRAVTGDSEINLTLIDDSHYRLDPAVVEVDLWQLTEVLERCRHTPNGAARIAGLRDAIDLYPADLAESMTADWIDPAREELRRTILDAYSVVIHATTHDDPADALALLERARGIDPCNEAIYRDLMRTQARLGRHDSIPRTLALLTTTLAGIGEHPDPGTVVLANNLENRHDIYQRQAPRAS